MKGPPTISPLASEALQLLGRQVRLARKQRRLTVEALAARVGVSPVTIRKVERGDATVALGTAFEAAVVVGVALFHPDLARRHEWGRSLTDQLALLPASVRTGEPDDDF